MGGDGEESQAEAWTVLGGGHSTAQRLRDDFAQASGLPVAANRRELGATNAAADTAVVALAPGDVVSAVEKKPDEIDWPLVTRSLSTELCKSPDSTGSLMLHRLAAKRAPLSAIQAALEAFPEALHERTGAGNLAYDLAVAAGADAAVVDKLFVGHLKAMGELDELKSVLENEGGELGLSHQAQAILANAAKSRARLCEIDSESAKKLGLGIVDRRLLGELISGSRNLRRVQEKQAVVGSPATASADCTGPELPLELALKHQAPGVVVARLIEEQPSAHGTTVEGVLAMPAPVWHICVCPLPRPGLCCLLTSTRLAFRAQGICLCTGPLSTRLRLMLWRPCSQVNLGPLQSAQQDTIAQRAKLQPTVTAPGTACAVNTLAAGRR